jgi:hypothetical protein
LEPDQEISGIVLERLGIVLCCFFCWIVYFGEQVRAVAIGDGEARRSVAMGKAAEREKDKAERDRLERRRELGEERENLQHRHELM